VSINGKTIAVVIPALNEETSIARVIESLPSQVDYVVVCDNGSTDATSSVAQMAGARVVFQPQRGYGIACLTALRSMTDSPPDIVAFIDADFSDVPQDLIEVLDPIVHGSAELCIGSRNSGNAEPGSLTHVQRFGNWLSTGLIDMFWGVRFTDLGPMRAIKWDALQRLEMRDVTWGWTVEMQLKAAKSKLLCTEVPVQYRNRIGKSKISGTFIGSVKAGSKILLTIATQSGYHVSAIIAALCIVIGALLVATSPDSLQTSSAVMFSTIGSVLWLLFGFCLYKLGGLSRNLTRLLMLLGVVGHMALASSIGLLSDDQYRYEWDGRLMVAGVSPYVSTPDSEPMRNFRGTSVLSPAVILPDSLPYSSVGTIYPPAAQQWFKLQQLSHRIFNPLVGSILAWKLPTLLAIIVCLLSAISLLNRMSQPSSNILPVLLSPLLMIHSTADVHIDIAMLMFGLLAVLMIRQPIGVGLLWGWATLVKFLPLIFLPILTMQYKGARRILVVSMVFLTFVAGYVVIDPNANQGSLSLFVSSWESNGFLFRMLKLFLVDDSARMVIGGVLVVLSVGCLKLVKNKFHAAVFIMMMVAVVSPVLHPWYLIPLLFTLPFFNLKSAWILCATVTLSGTFYLGYKNSGMWVEHPAIIALEFIPVITVLCIDVTGYLKEQRSAPVIV
jgi:hypothetical protein